MLGPSCSATRPRFSLIQVFVLVVAGLVALPWVPAQASSEITTTFEYTGSTQMFTVPAGVTSIDVTLEGGQGGRGGHDSQGTPETGGYQGVVTGTISVTPGDELTVAVGGGGGTGASSTSAAGTGGNGGLNPLVGYDGAKGGNPGNSGSSGAGGGSGAATVLVVGGTDIVAGGAGGNGGSGQYTPIVGRRSEPTHTPRPDDPTSTSGRPGWHSVDACTRSVCDGGGGGAGGAGAVGGERGTVQYGGASATEYFGFGGFPGANSTAGFAGLSANYSFYSGNNSHGSVTISFSDGTPSAPLNLAGSSGTGEIPLEWDAPVSVGSSPITDYVVEYGTSTGGVFTEFADGVSTSTSTVVAGLTDGVTYFFRVTAVNSIGSGPAAATSVGIVPSDVPGQPTIDAVSPTGGGALVDFTPGASDIEISSYEYRLDGGVWQTGAVSGDRLTIGGLTNGVTYSVEIRAINAIGASAASAPAVSVTPIDVAQAPTGTLLSAGDGTIDVSWVAPAATNGSPVSDYVIEYATSVDGLYSTVVDGVSTSTSATISGLVNGTTYFVRVGAVNGAGTGPWSVPVSATPFTSPSAPTVDVVSGDGSLTVGIKAGFDGGSAVTGWQYRLDGGAWVSTGSVSTEFVVSGLVNATSYSVEVRAVNAAGAGVVSAPVVGTPRTVPAAPAISAVALNTGAVSVSFTVGASGGSAITNVEYSIDGGATWVTRSPASTASPLTVNGLTGGVTYPIQLRVLNEAGASAASNTSTVTAKGTPDAPVITVAPQDRSVTVTFDAPANGGSPISNYEYSIDDGATWVTPSPAATSPITITGLTNGTAYDVRVRAVNVAGFSPASAGVSGTPRTVASAPTIEGSTAAGGDGTLAASFTAPVSDGGSTIVTYEYSTDNGATWRTRGDGASVTSPVLIDVESADGVTPLVGGAEYPVQLRAVNAAGSGAASAVAVGIPTTVPDAPVIGAVTTSNENATVEFATPANGGLTIIRYEYRLDGGTWVDTGTLDNRFLIAGLTNATSPVLELRAVNSAGDSVASAPVTIAVFSTPDAPTLTDLVSGDLTLDAVFVAGADGGSAVTGYEYSTDGGATWAPRSTGTTGSPIVIDAQSEGGALVNGTIYEVQVRAVNAAGAGGASETLLAAPLGVPAAPTGLSVSGADSALVVEFVAGADGGSAITAVEYQLDGGVWADAGSLSSPFTIVGLVNGTSYDVAIRAVNAVGDGVATSPATGVARTVPGAPTAVGLTGGTGEVAVSWTAPVDDGGASISGYTVRVFANATGGTPIATCITTGATSCVVAGLTNGVTVHTDVVAENEAGASAASAPRVVATPLGVPVVQIASIESSAASLSVVVDIVDNGGRPVSDYEYQLDAGAWVSAGTGTSPFTIPGLSTGTEYSVAIRAVGPAGTSDPSTSVSAIPAAAPGAPTSLVANSGPGSAALSWTASASNGGAPITDYVVQYATSTSGPFTTFADVASTATTATVTGLTNATTYFFRVAATNVAGTGSNSPLASTTPLAAPSAPTINTITPGGAFLNVAFSAPSSNGGSAVTGYQYRLDGGAWRNATGTSSPITINGLVNGVDYDVELRAVNAVGGGTASAVVTATPFGLPGAIKGLRATPGTGSVLLEWDAANANGSPITRYNVIRWNAANEGSISASFTPTGTSQMVTGLTNGTTYYFTVEAENAAGVGPRSTPRTTSIVGGTVPSAPTALGVIVDDTTAELTWTAGAAGSSPITGYLVQYSTDATTWTTLASGSTATSASAELPSASSAYQLRVAAISNVGAGPFTTIAPPTVAAASTSGATSTTVDLTATVGANGGSATPSFEYAVNPDDIGTPAALTATATPDPVTGTDVAINATITDLTPGVGYSMRALATTADTTVYGPVVTFATAASIVTDDTSPVYTGSPVVVTATTAPAGIDVTRTFVGIDGTVYPLSSTPPTDAGSYQMVTESADVNFEASETVTLTIEPKPITVLVTAADRDYDTTNDVELELSLDGVVVGDDVNVIATNVVGRMVDPNVGVDKTVDIVVDGALINGDDAANYAATITNSITITITQLAQTIEFASTAPVAARVGQSYTPNATSSAGLAVSVTIDAASSSVCSITDGVVSFDSEGECTVVATQAGTPNVVAAGPIVQTFDIARTTQNLVLALGDLRITDGPVTLAADIDGRPLTYTAGPGGVCSVSGAVLTLDGAGTCVVTSSQAGTAVFLPAEATDTFVVSRVLQAVTWPTVATTVEPGERVTLPTVTSEGLAITYTASPTTVCVLDAGKLVVVGTGRCSLTAAQAGDATRASFISTTRYDVVLAADAGLTIDVDLDEDAVGGVVTIRGAGLRAGSSVTVEIDGVRFGTQTAQVATDGTYTSAVELPDDLAAGGHTITASATAFDDSVVNATEFLFVDFSGSVAHAGDGGGYEAIEAERILDTREIPGRLIGGSEYRVGVPDGLVGADATTLTLNLTVTEPIGPGYVTVYPCGDDRPIASATNYTTGETRANLVDVPYGTGDEICLWSPVATDAVIDVQGFHGPSNDSRLVPRTATRLVDTRVDDSKLAAGRTRVIDVIGAGMGSPSTSVVALNVAATDVDGTGYATVYPCSNERPLASNLNFVAGDTVSNEVLVEPGTDGSVCIYSPVSLHLVVDLNATYAPAGTLDFESIVATRIVDTRLDIELAAGETREWNLADGISAVALNVAATETAGPGFLTVFACDGDRPETSNVNYHRAGQTASNHVTTELDAAGDVCVYTSTATHVVIDVEGTYTAT